MKEQYSCFHANVVFRNAARTIEINSNRAIRSGNLTPTQFMILDALYQYNTLAVCELKEVTLLTSGNLTVVLRNMERDGLIERIQSDKDRRRSLFRLSEQGHRQFEAALPLLYEEVDRLFGIFSQDERKILIDLLKRFKQVDE